MEENVAEIAVKDKAVSLARLNDVVSVERDGYYAVLSEQSQHLLAVNLLRLARICDLVATVATKRAVLGRLLAS